ncbi:hypothetical protein CDCA_CDCA16G4285 [Cyanidium caldarium]|uniref:Proteasome subunit beta n=1 Tax=Cyanidium caldarium TaxID=2771 RepID=A0AAV9J1R2_CYACA|nr:hypothetical protein CDCA_CDCA16G4285 [Cyanidium caldarium]
MSSSSSSSKGGNGGGFNFDHHLRNQWITACLQGNADASTTDPVPNYARHARKTGTTIAGVQYVGGVVLGADTRATEDTVVADKNCEKIHYLASNMYCCGAGTAADTEATTRLIASQLELHRQAVGRARVPVVAAVNMLKRHLFRYQGYVSAALVLGGVDEWHGPSLYTIYPHGSVDQLPYVSMGSGSLAAMAVFEAGWREQLSEADARQLVYEAITAGIENDLGSGSNVDLCVIKDGGRTVEYLRGYAQEQVRTYRKPDGYAFPKGTTAVLAEDFRKYVQVRKVVSDL